MPIAPCLLSLASRFFPDDSSPGPLHTPSSSLPLVSVTLRSLAFALCYHVCQRARNRHTQSGQTSSKYLLLQQITCVTPITPATPLHYKRCELPLIQCGTHTRTVCTPLPAVVVMDGCALQMACTSHHDKNRPTRVRRRKAKQSLQGPTEPPVPSVCADRQTDRQAGGAGAVKRRHTAAATQTKEKPANPRATQQLLRAH